MITGDEPINPTTEVGMNAEVSQGFGLTFKQHMVIEFTKALITATYSNKEVITHLYNEAKELGVSPHSYTVSMGIEFAAEVIKQLNEDGK